MLLAATTAFLIGLSRLYLIEHYLTDVANGWLVGTIWLLVGIAVAEWWRDSRPRPARPAPRNTLFPTVVSALLIGLAGWQVATFDKTRNVPAAQTADRTVADIAGLFAEPGLPTATESILGNPLEPVNVILLAPDAAAVRQAMTQAGWTEATRPTLAALASAGLAVLVNGEDTEAPVTPYFWQAEPNGFAFQRPTGDKTLKKRHHVRFWRTRYLTGEGLRMFVAVASFDDGLDWQLLHHFDPDIDAERDLIVRDLTGAGAAAAAKLLHLSKPRLGQSVAGDPWFTDGRAAVLTVP